MIEAIRNWRTFVSCYLVLLLPGGILLALLSLDSWSFSMIIPAILLLGLAAVGILSVVNGGSKYFDRLRAERSGQTREDFLRHFEAQGNRREVAERVHLSLESWSPSPDIPIFPDDSLEYHFGLVVHEEIDDILKECLCSEPTPEEWGEANSLATVEELVSLVDRLYTGEPQTWPAWYELPMSTGERLFGYAMLLIALPLAVGVPLVVIDRIFGFEGAIAFRGMILLFATSAIGTAYCAIYALIQLLSNLHGRLYLLSRGSGLLAACLTVIVCWMIPAPQLLTRLAPTPLPDRLLWSAFTFPFVFLAFALVVGTIESKKAN